MTQPHKILCLAAFAATLLLLPFRASAQSGTAITHARDCCKCSRRVGCLAGRHVS